MKSIRILVIGAVTTTEITLRAVVRHGFEVVGVLGHEPDNNMVVSGWVNLRATAKELGVPFTGFKKINDSEHFEWASSLRPDIIFAVGFSQLLSDSWLKLPTLGCIGFHPTALPKGRGRAPLAWTVIEMGQGSATFFLMGTGADDGPIFNQVLFDLEEQDDASSVLGKIEGAIEVCLDEWLPNLKQGVWNPESQDETAASWFGKRGPEDGIVNWSHSSWQIDRLVKASTKPHPGAYTYHRGSKFIIWSSEIERNLPIRGVIGRVLLTDDLRGLLVQCGEGLLWIKEGEGESGVSPVRVGDRMGYAVEDEIHRLRLQLREINRKLEEL
jgi:methionyl-tRNA formyltransferase